MLTLKPTLPIFIFWPHRLKLLKTYAYHTQQLCRLSAGMSFFSCGKRSLKVFQMRSLEGFSSSSTFLDLNFSTEDSRCYKNINVAQHSIKAMSHWCRPYWCSHPAWKTAASAKPIYLFFPIIIPFLSQSEISQTCYCCQGHKTPLPLCWKLFPTPTMHSNGS